MSRNTEYFNQTNQEFKGWIALASGTGLTIQWEGDLEACTVIKDTSSHSNQECTFDNANEYCHRHGGELFVPDMYYWKYFFNPLCDFQEATSSNPFQATFSNQDYWINARRIIFGNKINIKTSSSWHLFNQLNSNNVYTGWN